MRRTTLLIVILVLSVIGYYAWVQRSGRIDAENKQAEAESRLGLDAVRVLSAHFERQSALKVGTLRGNIIARSEDKGFGGIVPSEQITRLPTSVNYFVEFARMEPGSYRYSPQDKTLTIDVPDVSLAQPNVDETKAQTEQKGVFISRRAALALARKASTYAAAESVEEARKPENLNKARENARSAIRSIAEGPLKAAGLGDVKVAISFPWEPKALSDEPSYLDASRPVRDVLREREQERARTTPATTPSS